MRMRAHERKLKLYEYSTLKMKIKDIMNIPTTIEAEDGSVSPETFDFLEEMKKRIDPSPYPWDEIDVWITTYPSLHPYLQVGRTTMPKTRPSMGSITVHSQRSDGKQAHFGIPDFWDRKELHHNPEFWWVDYEGKLGWDKGVKGHRKFDIKQNIKITSMFDDEPVEITFRGLKPSEKVRLKKRRKPA